MSRQHDVRLNAFLNGHLQISCLTGMLGQVIMAGRMKGGCKARAACNAVPAIAGNYYTSFELASPNVLGNLG